MNAYEIDLQNRLWWAARHSEWPDTLPAARARILGEQQARRERWIKEEHDRWLEKSERV